VLKLAIVVSCLMSVGNQVIAHQQKESISSILFNARTGNIEVAHRFYIHDAEHAIKQLVDNKADLISDDSARKAFGQYVEKEFLIRDNKGAIMLLNYVGHEVDGKFFWIYQEIGIPQDLSHISVKSDALREIWSVQRNIVVLEREGLQYLKEFTKTNEWQRFDF